jgi:NAD(P)-dependent dehydrogenase (short-subunit alcohol dehydrogenase family)
LAVALQNRLLEPEEGSQMTRNKGRMRAWWWGRVALQGGLYYLGWKIVQHVRRADIRGQVVLITGGSRGLGLLLARQFARQGCRIAVCARDEEELERARVDLAPLGAEVAVHRCDVADRDRVEAMVAAVVERFGTIDVVVNNAGIFQVGPFDAMTPGDFDRAMAVHFWGPLNVIWAALPVMRQHGGGQIVNVTSLGGEVSMPHLLPYDCAKGAFLRLSEGLQVELARHGVAVTTVVPGLMRTGMPLNASFKGNAQREFDWFSAGDSRLASLSAARAARRIVDGMRRREGKIVLSWQAKVVRMAHGLAPNVVLRLLSLVNGRLPLERGLRFEARRGKELTTPAAPSSSRRHLDEEVRRLEQPPALLIR